MGSCLAQEWGQIRGAETNGHIRLQVENGSSHQFWTPRSHFPPTQKAFNSGPYYCQGIPKLEAWTSQNVKPQKPRESLSGCHVNQNRRPINPLIYSENSRASNSQTTSPSHQGISS